MLKCGEEDDPSAETLSVVELQPPIRITSPDGSPQQTARNRELISVTGSGVKVPLLWNLTQDFSVPCPPQYMLLQRLPKRLAVGMSPTTQDCLVSVLNSSAELSNPSEL